MHASGMLLKTIYCNATLNVNQHWRHKSVLQWRQAHSGFILAIHFCHFVGGWLASNSPSLGSSEPILGGVQAVVWPFLSGGMLPCEASFPAVGGGGSPLVVLSSSKACPLVLRGGQYNSESRIDFTSRTPYPVLQMDGELLPKAPPYPLYLIIPAILM